MATGGKYSGDKGARGVTGGEAISRQLDQLAAAGGARSFHAKISYLTRSQAGYEAMDRAGLSVTQQTMMRWLAQDQGPSKDSAAKVDRAYEQLRHERLARSHQAGSLKDRLTSSRTPIEIHPVDQAGVTGPYKRNLNGQLGHRRVTPSSSEWEDLVDAWARDDTADMDLIYEGMAEESLGSDFGAYAWVASVGFAA